MAVVSGGGTMGCSMVLNRDLGNSHLVLKRRVKGTLSGGVLSSLIGRVFALLICSGSLCPVITAYSLDTVPWTVQGSKVRREIYLDL